MLRLQMLVALTMGLTVTWLGAPSQSASDWQPKLAADYLDARQKDWFEWAPAKSADGPCVSCHTGMPYLLARPRLRELLKETAPTMYERGLRDRLASHAGAKPSGALQSVETIFAAEFLQGDALQKTFDQLWALQKTEGPLKGGWQWYNANLDPWETPAQFGYGAAFAALAIGSAPPGIHHPEDAQSRIRALAEFLNADLPSRPLHVRLAMLWASTKLPSAMTAASRTVTIDEILQKQQPDGGWTLAALGPWTEHADAPEPLDGGGSHPYATAFTAFVLNTAAPASARSKTARALEWLKTHQDRQTGAWPAVSMNKRYPRGSMEEKFLQDAATAFAVLALTS
jgi:squalene-hopene/tetraprenyl-beta-curcumene cyclase